MQNIYSFLLLATQYNADNSKITKLLKKLQKKSLLDELCSRAYMHGIFPLVFKHLQANREILDAQFYADVKTKNLKLMQKHMLMSSELIKTTQLFSQNSIKSLAFKGPVLSQLIHKDLISRQYVDLDILVNVDSIYSAAELLVKNKYLASIDLKYLQNRNYLNIGKDLSFYNKELDIKIELHWKLIEKKLQINETDYFLSAQSVNINNHTIQTLSSEELLLYLAIHGTKHYFERLEWVVDIDRLIRNSPSLKWEMILEQTQTLKIKKLFLTAMNVCYALFSTPIPDDILQKIVKNEESIEIAQDIIYSIKNDAIIKESCEPININSINSVAKFKDSPKEVLLSKLRAYLQLKEGDITLINLPHYLSWVYYILRPFRIMLKYLR